MVLRNMCMMASFSFGWFSGPNRTIRILS
jgi:hypothetical protein